MGLAEKETLYKQLNCDSTWSSSIVKQQRRGLWAPDSAVLPGAGAPAAPAPRGPRVSTPAQSPVFSPRWEERGAVPAPGGRVYRSPCPGP